ncbi:MAG TPA: response regulator transcription factor [Candidatus Copromorpha excrementigallinarum]|uniref:Stage 0 sporulation protein A homolog n=1 Tax=Candidatus Allocopromorpha excrementigallinarum TaxID=2840742 RepID=A0A9D1L829_9FIRM|nr:response regulator transcription factor [Candidatus Copromorpha excrementigallinarum]
MYRIFIVEDDEVIGKEIARRLESWGFEARLCDDFRDVVAQFIAWDPQLVLMDISLPFFNGYHWCEEIRKISKVPVMFISSAGDHMNIIMAINMGADDFVTKPFDMDLLLTKVHALLRRSYDFNASHSGIFQHRGVLLNSSAATVTFGDKKAELSKNENRILSTLLENKGRTVSRDTLMNKLWETDSFVDENTLSVNVTRLRKTLASIGIDDLIKTKKGLGYIIE